MVGTLAPSAKVIPSSRQLPSPGIKVVGVGSVVRVNPVGGASVSAMEAAVSGMGLGVVATGVALGSTESVAADCSVSWPGASVA